MRATGAEPYVASTFDGPLGIAAALHAAAALRLAPACGLATLALFEDLDDRALPAASTGSSPCRPAPGLLGR